MHAKLLETTFLKNSCSRFGRLGLYHYFIVPGKSIEYLSEAALSNDSVEHKSNYVHGAGGAE